MQLQRPSAGHVTVKFSGLYSRIRPRKGDCEPGTEHLELMAVSEAVAVELSRQNVTFVRRRLLTLDTKTTS